jgi:hypothetical protein
MHVGCVTSVLNHKDITRTWTVDLGRNVLIPGDTDIAAPQHVHELMDMWCTKLQVFQASSRAGAKEHNCMISLVSEANHLSYWNVLEGDRLWALDFYNQGEGFRKIDISYELSANVQPMYWQTGGHSVGCFRSTSRVMPQTG